MMRKRGRPRKEVDPGVILHMLTNNAPISRIAKHIGIHRDTIYTNYRQVIEAARVCNREAWKKISDAMFEEFLEKKRLKDEASNSRRRYRRRF